MRNPSRFLLPILLGSASVALAQASSRALALVPAEAEAVACFPNPGRLEARWSALAGGFGEKDSFLGLKAQTGIDPGKVARGPILKVFLRKEGKAEAWAWLLPAAQAKDLLQGLKPKVVAQGWTWSAPLPKKPAKGQSATPLHGAAKPGFLVVASSPGALAAMLTPKGSLAAELAPYSAWMERHDACLVATRAGVEKAAKEHSASTKGKPATAEGEPSAPTPKAPKRLTSKVDGWMELAKTSVHHVLAGLDLTEDGGLRIEAKALLTAGSPLSRELEPLAPVAGNPLAGLALPGFALAVGGDWSSLFDLPTAIYEDLDTQGKVQASTKARVQQALEAQNAQIQSWGMTLAAPGAGQPLLGGLTSLIRVADSGAYLAAVEAAARAQGAFFEELGMAGAVTFSKDPLPGVASCTVTTRPGGKPEDPGSAQVQQGLAMAFGGDAVTVSTGALDGHRLLVVMGGPEQLKARLQEARPDRLPASIAAVDPDLGSGHRFALYLDLRGLRDLAQLAAVMFMGPEGKPLPMIPDVPAMGIALSLDPGAIEVRGSLRGETLRAAADFFKAVKTLLPADRKGADKP